MLSYVGLNEIVYSTNWALVVTMSRRLEAVSIKQRRRHQLVKCIEERHRIYDEIRMLVLERRASPYNWVLLLGFVQVVQIEDTSTGLHH